jgi:hypothetical protein
MLWCRRIKRKLRRKYYKLRAAAAVELKVDHERDHRLYWQDTIKMWRFWVAFFIALGVTVHVNLTYQLGITSGLNYLIFTVTLLVVWTLLSRLIDYIWPF